jgi:Family of unknown function (DUF5317)
VALVLPLVVGLALAPLLGGRWEPLGRVRLRATPVFYAAIALQLAAFPIRRMPWRTPDRVAVALWLVSFALFAAGLLLNVRLPGVPLVAAGLVSNVAAIVVNGGHMPALPSALRGAGLDFTVSRNSAEVAAPHLPWLVDRWAAPGWVPWANVFSIGDVAIAAGGLVFALVVTEAGRGWRRPPSAAPARTRP